MYQFISAVSLAKRYDDLKVGVALILRPLQSYCGRHCNQLWEWRGFCLILLTISRTIVRHQTRVRASDSPHKTCYIPWMFVTHLQTRIGQRECDAKHMVCIWSQGCIWAHSIGPKGRWGWKLSMWRIPLKGLYQNVKWSGQIWRNMGYHRQFRTQEYSEFVQ